jgi:hypothetical protein
MARYLALSLALTLTACGGTSSVINVSPQDAAAQDVAAQDAPPSSEAGAPATITCTPDAGAASTKAPDDPSSPSTVTGTNGTFGDSCTSAGDLTDYTCETASVCGSGVNPDCKLYETGRVIPTAVDCAGHCANGACDARCPTFNQVLRFVTVSSGSGDAVLDNTADGRRYTCTVSFDSKNDSFDCKTGPQPGMTVTITSMGLHSNYCAGADFGGFGVKFPNVANPDNESCAYECSIPR